MNPLESPLIDLIRSHLDKDLVVHTSGSGSPRSWIDCQFWWNGRLVSVYSSGVLWEAVVKCDNVNTIISNGELHGAFLASRERFLKSPEIQKAAEAKFETDSLNAINKLLNL